MQPLINLDRYNETKVPQSHCGGAPQLSFGAVHTRAISFTVRPMMVMDFNTDTRRHGAHTLTKRLIISELWNRCERQCVLTDILSKKSILRRKNLLRWLKQCCSSCAVLLGGIFSMI
jgi:Tfp pilus assembly protein PilV